MHFDHACTRQHPQPALMSAQCTVSPLRLQVRRAMEAASAAAETAGGSNSSSDDDIDAADLQINLDDYTVAASLAQLKDEKQGLLELMKENGISEEDVTVPNLVVKHTLFHAVHVLVRLVVPDKVRFQALQNCFNLDVHETHCSECSELYSRVLNKELGYIVLA